MEMTGPLSSIRKFVDNSSDGPLTTTPVTPPDLTAKTCKKYYISLKVSLQLYTHAAKIV